MQHPSERLTAAEQSNRLREIPTIASHDSCVRTELLQLSAQSLPITRHATAAGGKEHAGRAARDEKLRRSQPEPPEASGDGAYTRLSRVTGLERRSKVREARGRRRVGSHGLTG